MPTKAANKKGLHYIGDGQTNADIPARDLTPEEVEQYNEQDLLDTGLYQRHEDVPADAPTDTDVPADNDAAKVKDEMDKDNKI